MKSGIPSVNESFSKRFKFADNSRRIRFECAQKPEQPLQPSLLACVMRRNQNSRPRRLQATTMEIEQGYRADVLFAASCILAHHRAGVAALRRRAAGCRASATIGAGEAVVAASAAVSDMTGFCERQPDACVVGAQAAAAIGQRAQAGAKMVYEYINDRAARSSDTGSVATPKSESKKGPTIAAVRTVPASAVPHGTLSAADLESAWQGPPARSENVPLPRRAPHRKA
jgi:Family of unknown function (DUF5330)